MFFPSILGSFSVIISAVYKKNVCNPKVKVLAINKAMIVCNWNLINTQVHPIFVLAIVDAMLSLLWISGSVVWLRGGDRGPNHPRVGCFTINLMTVVSVFFDAHSESHKIIYCLAHVLSYNNRKL